MNILQIRNKKIEIRKTNGSLVRIIGGDVVSADYNTDQSLIAIVLSNGKIEIRKEVGTLVRTFNPKATFAKWYGKELMVETKNNKTQLLTEIGTLIRNI